MKAEDYLNKKWGAAYEAVNSRGYLVLDVLRELWGKPWNDIALGFVHSLRPSVIRISKDGCVTCDSTTWRVTVYLQKDGKTIKSIEQEVEVGLPEGCEHGAHLDKLLDAQPTKV